MSLLDDIPLLQPQWYQALIALVALVVAIVTLIRGRKTNARLERYQKEQNKRRERVDNELVELRRAQVELQKLTTALHEKQLEMIRLEESRQSGLSSQLRFEPHGRVGSGCSIAIRNDADLPLHRVRGYITIKHDRDDVLDPNVVFANGSEAKKSGAFISPTNYKPIAEERLCWAFREKDDTNAQELDLQPGEQQSLDVMDIRDERGTHHSQMCFQIASERGFSTHTPPGMSRVCMKTKVYTGEVKIVSTEVNATFKIKIDPSSAEPITVL